jgi:hypothetical protein
MSTNRHVYNICGVRRNLSPTEHGILVLFKGLEFGRSDCECRKTGEKMEKTHLALQLTTEEDGKEGRRLTYGVLNK